MPGSVDVDSMGRVVLQKRSAFLWDPDDFSKPLLFDPDATRPELDALIAKAKECTKADLFVRHGSYVPLIASAAARNNVQPPDEGTAELAALMQENLRNEFFEDVAAFFEYVHGTQAREEAPVEPSAAHTCAEAIGNDERATATAATSQLTSKVAHNILHLPGCPEDCETCAKAKMKKKPAKRRKNQTKKASRKTTKYNELKSVDLLDPGEEDVNGNRYLFTTKDDYTQWPNVIGIKSKEPVNTAAACKEDARDAGGYAERYRTDNGGEWEKEFDDELKNRFIKRKKGLPRRPTTDSRHERWHNTLNAGVRALLSASWMPLLHVCCDLLLLRLRSRHVPSYVGRQDTIRDAVR